MRGPGSSNLRSKDEYHIVEYQLRLMGKAVGSPMTLAIHEDPKVWRKKQTGGAVLLSSTPITKEEYLMKMMISDHKEYGKATYGGE